MEKMKLSVSFECLFWFQSIFQAAANRSQAFRTMFERHVWYLIVCEEQTFDLAVLHFVAAVDKAVTVNPVYAHRFWRGLMIMGESQSIHWRGSTATEVGIDSTFLRFCWLIVFPQCSQSKNAIF